MNPRIIVGASLALAWLLVALIATMVPPLYDPKYEASAQVWVDWQQGDQQTNLAGAAGTLQAFMLKMTHAIDRRPVAEQTIQRLGLEMSPAELLSNLSVEQVENTSFIVLTYQSSDPVHATRIVNTASEVSSELISERGAPKSKMRANVYEEALVPDSPR